MQRDQAFKAVIKAIDDYGDASAAGTDCCVARPALLAAIRELEVTAVTEALAVKSADKALPMEGK